MAVARTHALLSAAQLTAWAVIGILSLGCSLIQFVDDTPSQQRSMLAIDCKPPEASVAIDGRHVGLALDFPDGTIQVEAGPHLVEISHDGYYPYRFDLDAQPGRLYRLELDLIRNIEEDLEEPSEAPAAWPGRR